MIDVITIITFILLIGLICLNYYHVDATTPIFHKKEVKKAPPKAPVKPYVRIQDIKDGESIEPNKEYTATLINPPEGKHIKGERMAYLSLMELEWRMCYALNLFQKKIPYM